MKNNGNVEEERSLPVNRTQAFFYILRNNYKEILFTSVFMTLFALPVIAVMVMAFMQLTVLGQADMSVKENLYAMYEMRRWMYFWCIPASAIFAVGASGGFYVVRRLAWNQDVKFFRDFCSGIKSNAIQFVIVTLIFAVFAAALCYIADFLMLNYELGDFYVIMVVIQAALLVFALALLLFQYCEIVVYKGSLFKQIKNSFVLMFGSLPRTVLIMLGELAPFVIIGILLSLNVLVISLVITTAFALIGFAYCALLFTLHSHSVFDKSVNLTAFPDIYRKGLYDGEAEQKKYEQQHKRNIFD